MTKYIFNLLNRARLLLYKDSLIFKGLAVLLTICFMFYFDLFGHLFKLFISFVIFYFIFNNFNYSKNLGIRLVQKVIMYILCFYLSVVLCICFDIFNTIFWNGFYDHYGNATGPSEDYKAESDNKITKDLDLRTKSSLEIIIDAIVKGYVDNSHINGAYSAGGVVGAVIVKSMEANTPTNVKIGIGLASATGTSGGVVIGAKAGEYISDLVYRGDAIKNMVEVIKDHPYSDPDHDRIPSPDPNMINSPLEFYMYSHLQDLFYYSFTLDILFLILLLLLLFIIFNRYVLLFNLKFIYSILNKYIPIKFRNWFNKNNNINTGIDYNNNWVLFIFIIIGFALLLFVLLKIFISFELLIHIDKDIFVHNYIHGKDSSILLCITSLLNNKNIKIKNKQRVININSNRDMSTISNKDLNQINKDLYNNNLSYLEKFSKKDLLDVYSYGNNNPDKIKDNNDYLEIMDILGPRVTSSEKKLLGGYKEVGEFRNIILLEDNIEIEDETNQDFDLNEEYEIYDMLNYKKVFEKILNDLDENRVYKMVFKIQLNTINTGSTTGREDSENKTTPSFLIYKNSSIDFILYKFKYLLTDILSKYDVPDDINMFIFIKEWIDSSKLKEIKSLYSIISKKESSIVSKHKELKSINKFKVLDEKSKLLGNIRKNKPSFLAKGLNYGEEIIDNVELFNIKFLLEGVSNSSLLEDKFYKLSYGIKNKKYIIKVSNVDNITNNVSTYLEIIDNNTRPQLIKVEEWTDIINNSENTIIRKVKDSGQKLLFVNNEIDKIEVGYNCKILQESKSDLDKDLKIGVFDIETYLDTDNNVIPYYIGVRTGDKNILYKITDFSNYDEMILKFIDDIMINENHNRFFYALNMSNFDGIIVLKSLINTSSRHNYKFKTLSKNDGTLLSVVLTKQLTNKKIIRITLADSYHLLPFSLAELGKVFCSNINNYYYNNSSNLLKGNYPHDFVNKKGLLNALNYKGAVPDIKYFDNISLESYNSIVDRINKDENGIWNSEKELINYLNKDIDILYTVMYTFGSIIYDKFNINITRIRTYSGLSFLIYTSKYYNSYKTPIHLTSGKIDKYIRDAYYGGVVDQYATYINETAYKYDINSHYPNQMKDLPMPGGQPRFSNETNLDKIFGFVRAVVTAPSEKELRVPILPINKNGKLITFRGTEEGSWFSEELKYALKLGYKIIIKDCIQFTKLYGLFDNFTSDLYKLKSQAELEKDFVSRLIFKLILNSNYGRWALKDFNVEYKILENSKIERLNKIENIDVLFSSDRLSFVKCHGPVYPEIVELFEKEKLIIKPKANFNEPKAWGRNVSAVQLSAAITAYARMAINDYKNIPGNLYYGGDTDSFILQYPLDPKLVGPGIGLSKLEHIIVEGFFHSKKSYLILNDKNECLIKMKGINNNNSIITKNSFIKLFKGEDVKIRQLQFKKDYKNMNVKIEGIIKTIKGITDKEVINQIKEKYP